VRLKNQAGQSSGDVSGRDDASLASQPSTSQPAPAIDVDGVMRYVDRR
jgi:hypothetical protein